MNSPLPPDEVARLQSLYSYDILDTAPEPVFDRISGLAARLLKVPIALISFIDHDRQWFKSRYGLLPSETPRQVAFCSHTILGSGVLVVPDARLDARFTSCPLVMNEPKVRFYAGAPLLTEDGFSIGTIAIIDVVPRQLSDGETATLQELAVLAMDILELRRAGGAQAAAAQARLAAIVESSTDAIASTTMDGIITSWNHGAQNIYGYAPEEVIGRSISILELPQIPSEVSHETASILEQLRRGEKITDYETKGVGRDGRATHVSLTISPLLDANGTLIGAASIARDITEQKRLEAALRSSHDELERRVQERTRELDATVTALRHSEWHLRFALEVARMGTWNWDMVTGQLTWSSLQERLFGLSPGSFDGSFKGFHTRVHPDDRNSVSAAVEHALAGGDEYSLEYRILWPDSTVHWIHSGGQIVRDARGEPSGMAGVSLDITERKRAEESQRGQQELLQTVLDHIPAMLALFKPSGQFYFLNREWERVLGWSLAEVQSHPDIMAELYPDPTDYRKALDFMLEADGEWWDFKSRVRDGRIIDTSWISIHLPDGRRIGLGQDITTRKASESQNRFQADLLNAVGQAVIAVTLEGTITYWNHAAENIFGWPMEEAVGSNILDLAMPESYREEGLLVMESVGRGEGWSGELEVQHRDGTLFPILLTNMPFHDESGVLSGVVGIATDITERKRIEADLGSAKEEAERADLAKSEFLSRMSHELRTPLNSILGFGQLLEMDELSPRSLDSLEHIMRAGQHLLGLINEVLDIAGIESGRQAFSIEPVHVGLLLGEALDLMRPLADKHGVELGVPECEHYVLADQQRLKQIFLNLLSNAVKYNRAGGRVSLSCDVHGDKLQMGVSDTGYGLSPEDVEKVYTPFERLGAINQGTEGTGLGLPVTKRLVEAMGGEIGVESVVGQGTTFWIKLPLSHSPEMKALGVDASVPPDLGFGPQHAGRTLLYIEDNLANLKLIERLFMEQSEITLLSAMQGSLGLDLAQEHQPDLILLDLHLPDINGDEVLRLLRADPRTRDIPVIMLSADASPGQLTRLLSPPEGHQGAQAYLTKPLNVRQFQSVLKDTLASVS